MDTPIDSYRALIEAFGFSKVYALAKRVSSYCMSLLEYTLEHELKLKQNRDMDLQEFADELFG